MTDPRSIAAAEAALKSGDRDEARRLYDRMAVGRGQPEIEARLAGIAHALGLADAAVRHMRHAAKARPGDAALLGNLGALLNAAGRADEARAPLERAIKLKPDFAAAHYNLGIVLARLGDPNAAAASYQRAIALDPRHAGAHLNLANLLSEARLYGDAVGHYRLSLAARPQPGAWISLGNTLKEQGYWQEARQAYQQALALRDNDGARIKAATVLPLVPQSEQEIAHSRADFAQGVDALLQRKLAIADPAREVGSTHFALAYQGGNDKDLAVASARLFASACPTLLHTAPHCRDGAPRGEKLRVGFCSRFLRDHSIGRLMLNLIRHMATTGRYEVFVFTFPQPGDAVWDEIARHAVEAVRIPAALAEARAAIAERRLDVLVYPDIGMEPMTYFLAFARLAPVQCVTWGHPVTTGIPAVDYFLSCDAAEPPDGQDHYSETLVRLGGLPMSYRRPPRPDPMKDRATYGLPVDAHLYFCAQNLFKIHPALDRPFAEILARDPQGRLLLLHGGDPHWAELLLGRYRAVMGDAADRVIVLPRQSHADYMNLLALSDVSLDSLPFSGGNTTYQALAMGTPVVTLPGKFLRGRLSLAIYAKAGVMDLVAKDAGDYVTLALRAANDRAWRADVMARIEAASGVIFDDREYLMDVERFLARVVPSGARGP
ncbi:MAG: tetratricopeptide repeat protein [Alphaproteobacteria bacterium]|nr:tetratricopeptide repeat protein [Alphaproteobacteria bacterium]